MQILLEKGILTEADVAALEAEVSKRKQAEAAKPVGTPEAAKTTVTFKGQYRVRGEGRTDRDFSNAVSDNRNSVLQRARFGINVDNPGHGQVFLQLQDSRTFGSELSPTSSGVFTTNNGATTGTANEALDVHQAFWQTKGLWNMPVTIRLGRQEIALGDERLVGAFGWDNVGRSFDGIHSTYKHPHYTTDLFYSKVVESNSVILPMGPNLSDEDVDFMGAYLNWPKQKKGVTDAYLLYKRDARAATYANVGTIGIRRKGLLSTDADYSFEGAYQFGGTVAGDQSAHALAASVGYNVPKNKKALRFAIEYDMASGDQTPGDGESETFDQLYPTNHDKYGYMDYQGWRNMRDLRLTASGKPTPKLTTSLDWHWFRLDEATDAWYGAGGAPNTTAAGALFRDPTGAAGRDVGRELDIAFKYAASDKLSLTAGYSRFLPGDFVKAVNGGADDNSDWYFVQSQVDF